MLLLLMPLFSTCQSQEGPPITNEERQEIQEYFAIKGDVKEIKTDVETSTTIGKQNYGSITYFYKNGAPKETKLYEDGKLKNTEPWRFAEENDDKGWEFIKEFDNQKRLIKTTKYNDGQKAFVTDLKYDSAGNKVEEYESINKVKKQFINNASGKVAEEIEFQPNDTTWSSRKKYKYDDKLNRIELLIYYYPDENNYASKIVLTYDPQGSNTRMITYDKNNNIIEDKKREITYYD